VVGEEVRLLLKRAIHQDNLRADADVRAHDGTEGQRGLAELVRKLTLRRAVDHQHVSGVVARVDDFMFDAGGDEREVESAANLLAVVEPDRHGSAVIPG
jgi:hypothetical protein